MKGMAIETVGYLVLAVLALILLFVFFSNIVPFIKDAVESIIIGIKCWFCNILDWGKYLVPFCWGC